MKLNRRGNLGIWDQRESEQKGAQIELNGWERLSQLWALERSVVIE